MREDDKPNPFEVIKLSTTATNADIVARRRELDAIAEEEEQMLYRWATEELITNPLTRLSHELFEVPGTQYEDPSWEQFMRTFKRNPVRPAVEEAPAPSLDDVDLSTLLKRLLDSSLTLPEGDLQDAIKNPPFSLRLNSPPLEVRDVIF